MGSPSWTPAEDALLRLLKEQRPALTFAEITARMQAHGFPRTQKAIERRWERLSSNQVASEPVAPQEAPIDLAKLKEALKRPRTLAELSRMFDRSEETIELGIRLLKDQHYNIVETATTARLERQSVPPVSPPTTLQDLDSQELVIAVASDLHCGSHAQQITALNRFVDVAVEQYGASVVLVPGDVCAGIEVYAGQVNDVWAYGADEQVSAAVRTLPKREGLRWILLGGNHDYSWIRKAGFNILQAIVNQRPDCTYAGFDMADIPLTDRVDVRLWHPKGGEPYAISYRLQKGMEAMAHEELNRAIVSGENPRLRIVLSGHLHQMLVMQRGLVYGLQCGCFEGQNSYTRRKALFPQVGGYVLRIRLADNGLIQQLQPNWLAMTEIEGDWQHYPDLTESWLPEPKVGRLFWLGSGLRNERGS